VFGKELITQPVIKAKLALMVTEVEGIHHWLENITYQMNTMDHTTQSEQLAGPIALLKLASTRVAHNVSDHAVQIFGGRGITKTGYYLSFDLIVGMGRIVEALQRTYKFGAILGGSEEIVADLGIRQAMKNYPLDAKL